MLSELTLLGVWRLLEVIDFYFNLWSQLMDIDLMLKFSSILNHYKGVKIYDLIIVLVGDVEDTGSFSFQLNILNPLQIKF